MKWAYAETPQDAIDLRSFFCTDTAPVGDPESDDIDALEEEWEYEVQVEVQAAPIPPPLGEHILIGRDDGLGIAAVCWWGEFPNPRNIRLFALARALRVRGQSVGDELMHEFKARLRANAEGTPGEVIMVMARVDRGNDRSQALLDSHEFVYINNDGWYQQWWLRLPCP